MSELPAFLSTKYIVGWRFWYVYVRGGVKRQILAGSQTLEEWLPRERKLARCRWNHPGDVPLEECYCGVYALKEKPPIGTPKDFEVLGQVALWGRILEGPDGYRAEMAYPLKFYKAGKGVNLKALAKTYGCEHVAEMDLTRVKLFFDSLRRYQ